MLQIKLEVNKNRRGGLGNRVELNTLNVKRTIEIDLYKQKEPKDWTLLLVLLFIKQIKIINNLFQYV